jgi:hypothetical protein
MKSVKFDFGSEQESSLEGKGIDWLLDPFLQKKVTGQAGFDYEIVRTRSDLVTEVLSKKYRYTDPARVFKLYDFYTLFLSMNVKMDKPATWDLRWARFEYEIYESNTSVLSFAPEVDGIKTTIEKNGSREFNMSLSAEIGPSLPDGSDPKINANVGYGNKKGWNVKYDARVEEVRGFKQRTTNGRVNLQWDIYKNKATEIPGSSIGETSGIYASALVSIPKGSRTTVNVKVSGETLRKGIAIRSHGIIELATRSTFNLQPTV